MSKSPAEIFQHALSLHQQGLLDQAQSLYQEVLRIDPNHFNAMQLLGVIYSQKSDYVQAIHWLDLSLALSPKQANTWNNRARALFDAGQLEEAKMSALEALKNNPNHSDAWFNLGCISEQETNYSEAVANYNRVVEINPNHFTALKSRAMCLRRIGRIKDALVDCEKAYQLTPNDEELLYQKASLNLLNSDYHRAAADFKSLLERHPNDLATLFNSSQCLRMSGDLRGALDHLLKAYNIDPDFPLLLGEIVYLLCLLCDWSRMNLMDELVRQIYLDKNAVHPCIAQRLFEDLKLLYKNAGVYFRSNYNTPASTSFFIPKGKKIKVGYYSSDFGNHAMSILIPEVIESHNRKNYEVYLFSLSPSLEVPYRQRLRQACDHFIEAELLNTAGVVQKSRELEIDIAIDLMGFTAKNRHEIFLERCAPVQVAWAGMPGTSGSTAIDYIIADPIMIPETSREYYSEQVVHLPCCGPNDSTRSIADRTPTRGEMGLPENAFVFCCFNICSKILPESFYGWMRIMAATPGSVFWLLNTNDEAVTNLRKSAMSKGISSDRLIFANRMPVENHLSRHRLADIELDTFPCGAHTTATDALWAGLPVLTRSGQSFASRVAASYLSRIGLPELITDNQADFEARAIYLANDGRAELKAIREKLAVLRKTSPLFDGKAFAKDLEKAYKAMYDRSQAGLKPDFISVV